METLKIKIPNGYEVDSFDKLSGEIKFKEKERKKAVDRIKNINDVLTDHGMTQDQFDDRSVDLEVDEAAYRLLKLLASSLNDGWTPDWENENEYKWYPYFYMGVSSGFRFSDSVGWNADSGVGSRLCFKSRELADYAGKQFTEVYKKFMTT